ncbi:glutamate--tRNA ligase family protein, partial [Rhizobium ruizarguesonis]
AIVETLQSYGFEWDGDMLRQSERHAAYRDAIERLLDEGLAYACTCSRKQLEGYTGPYPGLCRAAGRSLEDVAIRLRVPDREYVFIDRVQ